MTTAQYRKYQTSVDAFLARNGIYGFSCKDKDRRADLNSTLPCEVCRRSWMGGRHDVIAYVQASATMINFRACSDCVYYAENGALDAETLASMR